MLTTLPLFGAIPGGPEMLIILLVLVLLFGANKIPKLARSTGQAMGEFKKGREQVEEELQEMQGGAGADENDEEYVPGGTASATTETTESESATATEPETATETETESVDSDTRSN